MNYLLNSFRKTKNVTSKKKYLFLILVILQGIFLTLIFLISANFQILIFKDLQGVINPLNEANLDQKSLEAGNPVLENMLPLLQNYRNLKKHVKQWFFSISGIFLLLNGFIWVKSFDLITNVKKLKLWRNFLIYSLFFILFLLLIVKLIFNNLFSFDGSIEPSFKIFAGIALILYYLFLFVLLNLNKSIKKINFKDIYKPLPVFLFNGLLLFLVGYLMYRYAETDFLIVVVLAFISIIILTFGRIFLINTINEESNN